MTLIPGGEEDAAFKLQGTMYGAKHCLGHDSALHAAGMMPPDPAQYYRRVAEGLMDPRFTMPTRGGADDNGDSTAAEKILRFVLDTGSAPMLYPPVEISGTIRADGDFLGSLAAAGQAQHHPLTACLHCNGDPPRHCHFNHHKRDRKSSGTGPASSHPAWTLIYTSNVAKAGSLILPQNANMLSIIMPGRIRRVRADVWRQP